MPTERSTGGGDYRDTAQPRCLSACPRSFKPDHFVPFRELLDHVQHHSDDRCAVLYGGQLLDRLTLKGWRIGSASSIYAAED